MRSIVLLILVGLAAACAPMSPQPEVATAAPGQSSKPVPASTAAACTTQGGDWRPICMMQVPACVLTFKDAGKSCTDSSQCSGACVASGSLQPDKPATGVCTATSDPCGCKQFVENGKAGYPLCAD